MRRHRLVIIVASCLFGVQAAITYGLARREFLPSPPPLVESLPLQLGSWTQVQDAVLDPRAYAMLTPDDVLSRTYRHSRSAVDLNLFVAYYKTQRRANNAHDPKVCLPGSGWNPTATTTMAVPIANRRDPLEVNRFLVSKGHDQAVVLYWFQTHNQVFAREQALKLSRIADNVINNRSDMVLVRLVAPVLNGDVDAATQSAVQLAQLIYPRLLNQFPPSP